MNCLDILDFIKIKLDTKVEVELNEINGNILLSSGVYSQNRAFYQSHSRRT